MTPEPAPDLTFEAALDQLGQIVSDLEQGEPELATALAKYEQAWNERLDRIDDYLQELQRQGERSDT